MDIDGERGDMVVAPANGVVTEAGWKGGYGQMIEIDHGNGLDHALRPFVEDRGRSRRYAHSRPIHGSRRLDRTLDRTASSLRAAA